MSQSSVPTTLTFRAFRPFYAALALVLVGIGTFLPLWTIDAVAAKQPPQLGEDAFVKYLPRKAGQEMDLWGLESNRFVRSEPVISPDRSQLVYTEAVFNPENRQTSSKLFSVPILNTEPAPSSLPSENAPAPIAERTPAQQAAYYQGRLDPDKTARMREELLSVGFNRAREYEFRTLSIIDWSATGYRLLFKQRTGILHLGLKVSDILIYDKNKGTVSIYPEIQRIIAHHWETTAGTLPNLEKLAWDIYPLGWLPGSDSGILLKVWAYDKKEKKFLGLWQYDLDTEQATLLSETNIAANVASNGLVPDFQPYKDNSTSNGKAKKLRFWKK